MTDPLDPLPAESMDLAPRPNEAPEKTPGVWENSATLPIGAVPPSLDDPIGLGRRIGPYQVLGRLGGGGMGMVYLAQRVDGYRQFVAVKVVRGLLDPAYVARFHAERQSLADLRHPNIVQLLDGGELPDGRPYLVMEFVEGWPIDQYAQREGLTSRRTAELFCTIAEAIQFAHDRGVVHRDLKPGNVLVTPQGQPKVVDFGLARRSEAESGMTVTGAVIGTPGYMSPEQAEGRTADVGPLADVYSLGATLYQVLVDRPPFKADSPMETLRLVSTAEPVRPSRLRPGLPKDLETICLKCLEKDRLRRYPTARELSDELRRVLAGEPIIARPVGRLERIVRWSARNRLPAALSATLALLAVASFVAISAFGLVARDRSIRAERNFARAFEAIDASFNRINSSAEMDRPEMSAFRRQLLISARDQYQEFLNESRGDPTVAEQQIRALMRLSQVERRLGGDSRTPARRAVALCEDLVSKNPGQLDYRSLLAWCWQIRSIVEEGPAGVEANRQAVALWDALIRDDPAHAPAYLNAQAFDLFNASLHLLERGETARAEECLLRARDIRERRREEGISGGGEETEHLALILTRLQGVQLQLGKTDEAIQSGIRAVELYEMAAAFRAGDEAAAANLAEAHHELYTTYWEAGDWRSATLHIEKAVEVLNRQAAIPAALLVDRLATQLRRVEFLHDLGLQYAENSNRTGDEAWAGRSQQAFGACLELCRHLNAVSPADWNMRYKAGASAGLLGQFAEQSDLAVALDYYRQARAELSDAVRTNTDGVMESDLAVVLQCEGDLLSRLDDPTAAERLLAEAVIRGRSAREKAPADEVIRQRLSGHLARWSAALLTVGRPEDALEVLSERAVLVASDAQGLWDTGLAAASLASAMGDSSTNEEISGRAGRLAGSCLRSAIELGHAEAARWNEDRRFDALRSRPELLAELGLSGTAMPDGQ
jgi:serine/threonine protein kinase